MNIETIVRKNILRLTPYSCARDEYQGEDAVFLDANENPYETGCNRYPDPHQRELKKALFAIKGVAENRMIVGNGSDEIIDMLIRSLCRPGLDNIVVFSPGYSMYEVCAAINDVEVRKIDMDTSLLPDWNELERQWDDNSKIIFICTPNNPVGNIVPLIDIENACRKYNGLVVVDEAYIDFTDFPSAITLLDRLPNLFVLQTLSKSWGMAGLRLGMGFSGERMIEILNRVKPPYNVSSLSQRKAVEILQGKAAFVQRLGQIKRERERFYCALKELDVFSRVYPSEANFILVTLEKVRELYAFLVGHGYVTRLRMVPPLIGNGLRISVGTAEENSGLLGVLKQWAEK